MKNYWFGKNAKTIASWFGLLSVFTCGFAHASIPASERAVLDALYAQAGGASWTAHGGWEGAAGTECSWYGIVCTKAGDHILQVQLASNGLSGTIPAIAALTQLQVFNANSNNLSGGIPALNSLAELQFLDVSVNALGGSIPALTGLGNLQYLDVSNNQLIGTIPAVDGLTNLQYLVVFNNRLTGSIPALSSLSSLQFLSVGNNNLTGSIPALTGLANLKSFTAPHNQLGGHLPDLSDLGNLTSFDVGTNQLTGSIPPFVPSAGPLKLVVLQVFKAGTNRLTGGIPSLTGLTSLQGFQVGDNHLTGTIPTLAGLTSLQVLKIGGNQLTGSFPPLTELPSLTDFDASSNQFSGSIPDLTALTSLRSINLDGNGFTGDPPAPATYLFEGLSSLCNNPLNHSSSAAWNDATGTNPWYAGCTALPTTLNVNTTQSGAQTTIAVAVTPAISNANIPTGSITVTDADGNPLCFIGLANGSGTCTLTNSSGVTNFIVGYTGDAIFAPGSSATATLLNLKNKLNFTCPGCSFVGPPPPSKTVATMSMKQQGLTGSWYTPATATQPPFNGQGFLFEVYPAIDLMVAGWFTYDTSAGGEDHKRWYTLISTTSLANTASTTFDIYTSEGGNFNASPKIVATQVGQAIINMPDCGHGEFTFRFDDGRVGKNPLTRGDSNVACIDPTNAGSSLPNPGTYLLSGAWYDANTSGQGFFFDINPVNNNTFAAWYTFAPNGQSIGGGASQRWYTLQIASSNDGLSTLSNIGIFSAQGGVFNESSAVITPQVGTASIKFQDCNDLTLGYVFTSGTNNGLSGTINMKRTGPTPAGCNL